MESVKSVKTQNGNEIRLIERQGKNNPKTILIIGVVHGEEPQGKILIENYLKSAFEFTNRMLFIPCLNPDGFHLKIRQNANKIDLNRNFPTKNWKKESPDSEYFGGENPLSEIETRFLVDVLEECSPDIILTLHAPFKIVNYDGPAKEIAEGISRIIGYPVQSDIGYPTPGSFGNYAGVERNIPTITLELDEEIDVNQLILPVNNIFNYLSEY